MRILSNPNYNFIRWRWHALALSVAIIVAGLATAIVRGGIPLGVDFTGGTVLIVQFEQPVTEDAVRNSLGPDSSDAVVQRIGAAEQNQILVRLPLSDESSEAGLDAASRALETRLREGGVGTFTVVQRDLVSPTIGADLRAKAVWAALGAMAGMLLYIGFRFRFAFAAGAVLATLHDVLVTLVFLMWFGYDLSLNVVAGILTVAGYSVNDTIVIFDRVRENQRKARREGLEAVVNRAVNETLTRTVITAGTSALALVGLYLFGGEVLEGFAFSMLVGVIAGTYSTIFIASSVAIMLSRGADKARQGGATRERQRAAGA
jgi:preprotein translocase subunit SecF